jgi:hypothetical protein
MQLSKTFSVFNLFDSQKASLLRSIGFGGLLKLLELEQMNSDELYLWLYKIFDFDNLTLHFDGGVDLPIRSVDVHLILSIPFEGHLVQYATS